jgi:hypothetical protein
VSSGFAFTKLFSSITESTIWCESHSTRIAWITLLAMADRYGRIWGSIPGLANRARITVDEARSAIESFLNPDPDSRTPDNEGRRIEKIDGGWRLLNHAKYRALCDEEEKRIRHAKNQAAYRERQKLAGVTGSVTNVTESDHIAEAEAEAEALKESTIVVESSASDQPGPSPSLFEVDEIKRRTKEGFDYFLEKTGKSAKQNPFNQDKKRQGEKGFKSLIGFAKSCNSPDPLDAATQLFRVAVNRLANSPWHNGHNPEGKRYLDWYQLFRSKDFPAPTKLLEYWLDDDRWTK